MTDLSHVRGIDAGDMLDDIGALRCEAWEPLLGADTAARRFGLDANDIDAWHTIIRIDGVLVAAGRLTIVVGAAGIPEPSGFGDWADLVVSPAGFLGRLAVAPRHRGRGLARRIIAARVELAADLGMAQVWAEARQHHARALASHGFDLVGDSSDKSVPGRWMVFMAGRTRVHPRGG